MGICCCRPAVDSSDQDTSSGGLVRGNSSSPSFRRRPFASGNLVSGNTVRDIARTRSLVDSLVLELLSTIRYLVEVEQEAPQSMLRLHVIADQERGWLLVIQSMINVVPMQDPLGPAAIIMLLDDIPLPTKDSILEMTQMLNLKSSSFKRSRHAPKHRNVCIILGCLADKLAGPNSIFLMTNEILDYLLANITNAYDASVVLFSLIALEKFAQTSENKITIMKRFKSMDEHPLVKLESWIDSKDFIYKQVGFCATWSLDNLFVKEDRAMTYTQLDRSNLNALLNSNDVSEYLKISSDGLIARCDAFSFESVRCTFCVSEGVWYYEATIITSGIMQIGWATKESKFMNQEGYGIGDDEYSLSYDGCRQLIWHRAESVPHTHRQWRSGDVLGCLLDFNDEQIIFYLNGQPLAPQKQLFRHAK